jgi:hypothetical protein
MKKAFVILILAISSFFELIAQTKTIDISEFGLKGQVFLGTYAKSINLELNDTLYYIYIGFQNFKYRHMSDPRSIILTTQDDLNALIKDLKTALPEIGTKVNIDWNRKLYGISLWDYTDSLILRESPDDGDGYTFLDKQEAEKFLDWLTSIQIGKD